MDAPLPAPCLLKLNTNCRPLHVCPNTHAQMNNRTCGASFCNDSVLQVTVQKANFRMDPGAARCAFVSVKALHADGSMAALDRDGKLILFNAGNKIDKLVSTRV